MVPYTDGKPIDEAFYSVFPQVDMGKNTKLPAQSQVVNHSH